jgi:hypothetical protein
MLGRLGQPWENSRSHLSRGIIPGDFHPNRCYSAPAGEKGTAVFKKAGYDDPVRAEPFNKPLNDLEDEAACAGVAQALNKTFTVIKT